MQNLYNAQYIELLNCSKQVLFIGVVHQRSTVRCATATLFGSAITYVSDQLANAKIVPAIVTLASDPEV